MAHNSAINLNSTTHFAATPCTGALTALAVIDTAVPHQAPLLNLLTNACRIAGLAKRISPILGLAAAIAQAGRGLSSIHLFSHGAPGLVHLAGSHVTEADLARPDIAALRQALAGRPLVLYGCSVGRGQIGRRFVEALSAALAAPVLASSTPTGAAWRGGDWAFDLSAGARPHHSELPFGPTRMATWPGLLMATVTSTAGDNVTAGSLGLAATTTDATISFSNLDGQTITLTQSPQFVRGSATELSFTNGTTSLTIGGSTLVSNSHLYFELTAGQSLTINSAFDFTTAANVVLAEGGGTLSLNGSLSDVGLLWIQDNSNAEIGTTTSPTSAQIDSGTLRFATSATYTTAIEFDGAGTIHTGSNNVTLSGNVTWFGGTAAMTKSGSGTLTLNGTGSTGGTMTISQGTLSVAGDSNLSSGAVTINGGTLAVTGAGTINNTITIGASGGTINTGAAVSLSGVIGGTGNLTKAGTGTLTVTGTNTNSGTTTVSAGTLSVESSGNLGSGSVVLNGGGLAVTGTTTISNDISGTGSLTKSGTGTTILSGTNTYTGGTTIGAGTLQVSGGSALADGGAVTVSPGATLDLNGTSETIGSLSGSGTLNIGSGTLTLTDSASTTFSGTISGSGTIAGGGTYTVASGATLGGTSTFSTAVTVANGGTIAPGNSPGIISTGNLTLASGSTATMEIDGNTAGTGYDQIKVTGTVTLSNATLNATLGYTPASGDVYTLIDNDGVDAVTGAFDGLAEGATLTIGGSTFQISYLGGTGNDVTLTYRPPPASDSGGAAGGQPASGSGSGSGSDTVSGTAGNDILRGYAGNDTLRGYGGLDVLYGNADSDLIYGNQGADTLYGGQGTDTLYGGQDADILCGNNAADRLHGNGGGDLVYGNAGDDGLWGEDGADTLYGGQGADTLSGGAGDDRLFGNLGADVFRFGDADGADTVHDFTIGQDVLAVAAGVNGSGIATTADLLARLTDDGAGNALLDLSAGNSVTLIGVSASQLGTDSFLIG
ncbi:DUF4347 domain-containing protein [Thalassobaculum sp. OXR-137]|uniref:DUF4347 domain-containing protein n=1 Tax=Thalassobaculum sp. OXR-137 TaxID=3100173 RepID=UPI002AC9A64C|nr:DUF4347 domain-containing protein [Thalassobaculum sp. OXR-137]WPZ34021.1 DUF4347 domain-containing protein [Thalassobaculum sp. OXR-137]